MEINVNAQGGSNLSPCVQNIDALETKITRIINSRKFRWFGFFGFGGSKELKSHLNTLTSWQKNSEKNSELNSKVSEVFNNILDKIIESGRFNLLKNKSIQENVLSTPANIQKAIFSELVANKSFRHSFNKKPHYKITIPINGVMTEVSGLGKREDGSIIASGGYGRCFFGKDSSGRDICVKVCKRKKQGDLERERDFLLEAQKLNHKNVVSAREVHIQGDFMFVVMDKASDGDLFDPAFNKSPLLTFKEKLIMLKQVAEGIKALHDIGIVHKDIKLENILVDTCKDSSGKTTYNCKVSDFGLSAKTTNDEQHLNSQCGTLDYMGPEIIQKQKQSAKTDWYAFGVMLHALVTGNYFCPIDKVSKQQRKTNVEARITGKAVVKDGDYMPPKDYPNHTTIAQAMGRVMKGCTRPKLKERWDGAKIIQNLDEIIKLL